jgi:hypothetical protein
MFSLFLYIIDLTEKHVFCQTVQLRPQFKNLIKLYTIPLTYFCITDLKMTI